MNRRTFLLLLLGLPLLAKTAFSSESSELPSTTTHSFRWIQDANRVVYPCVISGKHDYTWPWAASYRWVDDFYFQDTLCPCRTITRQKLVAVRPPRRDHILPTVHSSEEAYRVYLVEEKKRTMGK